MLALDTCGRPHEQLNVNMIASHHYVFVRRFVTLVGRITHIFLFAYINLTKNCVLENCTKCPILN